MSARRYARGVSAQDHAPKHPASSNNPVITFKGPKIFYLPGHTKEFLEAFFKAEEEGDLDGLEEWKESRWCAWLSHNFLENSFISILQFESHSCLGLKFIATLSQVCFRCFSSWNVTCETLLLVLLVGSRNF